MKNLYDFSGYLLESENPKWELSAQLHKYIQVP